MRYIPEPRYPQWHPDPDTREEQVAQYRRRLEEWQIAQDREADEAKERRVMDYFDDEEPSSGSN